MNRSILALGFSFNVFFLILLTLVFCWLILRELFGRRSGDGRVDRFNITYLGLLVCLAIACAWMPLKYWSFERTMASKTEQLAGVQGVSFHCNSAFDSIFDNAVNVAGHANPRTKEVVFQLGWCKTFMRYLKAPESADRETKFSLHLFVHEAMHIRGELNEPHTDCQALQRDVQAAELLGIDKSIVHGQIREYFKTDYLRHPYYTADCRRGGPLDESLPYPPW